MASAPCCSPAGPDAPAAPLLAALRARVQTALAQVAQALASSSDSMLIFLPDQQVGCLLAG